MAAREQRKFRDWWLNKNRFDAIQDDPDAGSAPDAYDGYDRDELIAIAKARYMNFDEYGITESEIRQMLIEADPPYTPPGEGGEA